MLKRVAVLLVLGLVLMSAAVMAESLVAPRECSVFLFDNETGTTVTKLGITFDVAMSVDVSDVIVFGGTPATLVASSNYFVWIEAALVPGGTLMIVVPEVDAGVVDAFWF